MTQECILNKEQIALLKRHQFEYVHEDGTVAIRICDQQHWFAAVLWQGKLWTVLRNAQAIYRQAYVSQDDDLEAFVRQGTADLGSGKPPCDQSIFCQEQFDLTI